MSITEIEEGNGKRMQKTAATEAVPPSVNPPKSGFGAAVDVVYGLLNGGNFFCRFIGDFSLEFLFQRHHQFYRINR